MLDLLQETFLTEQQIHAIAGPKVPESRSTPSELPPSNPPIPRQARHWSKSIRDPLGDALARIQAANTVPRVVETTSCDVSTAGPEPFLEQESVAECVPATLPMFDSKQSDCDDESRSAERTNRRRFPRRNSECRVFVIRRSDTIGLTPQEIDWLLESGRSVGRLQNICQLGICLLLEKDIPTETEVLLRISNEQLGRHVDMSAQVLSSQLTQQGTFSIHCQTLRDFTLDELQDLGQQLTKPVL